jgi:hypothetical protein
MPAATATAPVAAAPAEEAPEEVCPNIAYECIETYRGYTGEAKRKDNI